MVFLSSLVIGDGGCCGLVDLGECWWDGMVVVVGLGCVDVVWVNCVIGGDG